MKSHKNKRGIALLLVLASLVLITVLILAVLNSVGTFTQTAKAGSNNSSTRALVDDSVNLVIAQIRDATTLDQTKSWSSQPGMIRTYDNSGNQALLYKLYSAPSMVLDGSQSSNKGTSLLSTLNADISTTWDKSPGLYTDLNSPVKAQDNSTLVFPIVDPRAWSNPSTPAAPIPTSKWTGTGTTDVQGFSYQTAPVTGGSSNTVTYGSAIDGIVQPTANTAYGTTLTDTGARLPMPCQWLYVRKSGFIAAPTDNGNGNGTVNVPADPNFVDPVTGDTNPNPNPIVGRIAFWTDDETCKVNINTACGDLWSPDVMPSGGNAMKQATAPATYAPLLGTPGSFWEVPRMGSWYDTWVLSPQIPLRNEFQRYAGHPSTVYLSAVFPEFSSGAASVNGAGPRDQLYSIVPRVNGGTGTTGATSGQQSQNTEGGSQMPTSAVSTGTYAITPKRDRLYSSIDELLYTAARGQNPVITPDKLQRAKFFITADSKAPELNLFNLPRISMWPINSDYATNGGSSPYCTPDDTLLAYCSSLGSPTNPSGYYFFQRKSAIDGTTDSAIAQNINVFAYLQDLISKKEPGYGASLASKYVINGANGYSTGNDYIVGGSTTTDESNQILTEIWDYIRCINLTDPLLTSTYQFSQSYTVPANQHFSGGFTSPQGMVIPLQVGKNIGFGRAMTLGEVGLQMVAMAAPQPGTAAGGHGVTAKPAKQTVDAVLLLEGHSVSSSIPFLLIPNFEVDISNLPVMTNSWESIQNETTPDLQLIYFSNSTASLKFSNSGTSDLPQGGYSTGNSPLPLGGSDSTMGPIYLDYPSNSHMQVPNGGRVGFFDCDNGNTSSGYGALISQSFFPDPTSNANGGGASIMVTSVPSTPPATVGSLVTSAQDSLTGVGNVANSVLSGPVPSSAGFTMVTSITTITGVVPHQVTTTTTPGPLQFKLYITPVSGTQQYLQTITVDMSKLSNWTMPVYCSNNTLVVPRALNLPALPDPLQQVDSLLTMVPGYPRWTYASGHAGGDYRLLAGLQNVPASYWVPEGRGDPTFNTVTLTGTTTQPTSEPVAIAHNFSNSFTFAQNGSTYTYCADQTGLPSIFNNKNSVTVNGTSNYVGSTGYDFGTLIDTTEFPNMQKSSGYNAMGDVPMAPPTIASYDTPFWTEITHDFDQGAGATSDGAFINHPEETTVTGLNSSGTSPYYQNFYFNTTDSGQFGDASQETQASTAAPSEFATPNRLVPSPGILGSLPTGVAEGIPWQTLLFRAQPEHPGSGGYLSKYIKTNFVTSPAAAVGWTLTNIGSVTMASPPYAASDDGITRVPDHLFLDLFWMPVAEPYAISDTFSTTGKINLNYQIVPFTYIDRATAMQAVLRSQRMAAVPSNQTGLLKQQNGGNDINNTSDPRVDYRHDINLSTTGGGTLMQFENKFAKGDLFRSASQICDIFMVPVPTAWSANTPAAGFGSSSTTVESDAYNWWNLTNLNGSPSIAGSAIPVGAGNPVVTSTPSNQYGSMTPAPDGTVPQGFKLTGDNERELPYTNIYSLLTTKSNSYTIHMRVQGLQQARITGRNYVTNAWSDPASGGTDVVTGEYRGSASIERYLDTADSNLTGTNFTTAGVGASNTSISMSKFYKYRVTATKQFAP